NRVGALADVCTELANVGVNIKSINAQGQGDYGVIRLITEDENTAKKVLEKAGFKLSISDIIVVSLPDRPGELAKIARKLSNAGVDVECIYVLSREDDKIQFAIRPSSIEHAMRALR
ncbi:MAG: ACT domain-containing protein, partial [Candidatus Aenigmarchaeota archaeon]|nr:ACT domain-containing protein [Candidatus Aenigmarchaeota archaeon]